MYWSKKDKQVVKYLNACMRYIYDEDQWELKKLKYVKQGFLMLSQPWAC